MGYVTNLHIKAQHGQPVISQDKIDCIQYCGISNDVSQDPYSPRQVLVIRQEDQNAFQLPSGYLRENITISNVPDHHFEPGTILSFPSGAKIHLTFRCEPCKTISGLIPKLSDIMGRRGILGVVAHGGTIQINDSISCHSSPYKMADTPLDRVLPIIRLIPRGRVIDYAGILRAAGLHGPYYRVMPKYIEQARQKGYPAHRVVDTKWKVPNIHTSPFAIEAQRALRDELQNSDQDFPETLEKFGWLPSSFDILTYAPFEK